MTVSAKKKGLGRGLSALMEDMQNDHKKDKSNQMIRVPIESVHPNPNQPRRHFNAEELENLTASIIEKGIIQPIIVRPKSEKDQYEIIAGERRWRAAQKAVLHEIPVIVYDLSDNEVLEYAIIENVQRTDLNPIEEAMSYEDLIQRCGYTQEKLSSIVGKSRSYLSNMMRLLNLPDEVKAYVITGQLSTGHARTLLSSKNPIALAEAIVKRGLSVRDVENIVKKESEQKTKSNPQPKASKFEKDADTLMLEADLSAALNGMQVTFMNQSPNEGELKITYRSLDELDEVCRRLSNVI
jgi:ParB family transcriptional regulator, chromosome partitioning protein